MFRAARIGLVAMTLLLIGWIATGPARAEGPFWKVCAKVAGGPFEDSKCSKMGAVKEFEPMRLKAGEKKKMNAALTAPIIISNGIAKTEL